jgi:Protein of unknown function (DUF4058)
MRSPFPGMDPYLEDHWPDVHSRLAAYMSDALMPQLSDDLSARLEESVYIDEEERILRRPDLTVMDSGSYRNSGGNISTALLDTPLVLTQSDPLRQRSVVIIDSLSNRVITAIEILSPHNKIQSQGLADYLRKREQYLASDTHLIEIDLLRCGNWLQMIGNHQVKPEQRTTYRVTVAEASGKLSLYPIAMNQKLPVIEVPLRPHDERPRLELQPLLDRAYEMGRYHKINYQKELDPPLPSEFKQWMKEQKS